MRTVLLSAWLGAILFFALAVAPNVFAMLAPIPDGRSLAGDIVSRTLSILHYLGLACGALYIARGYRHLNTWQNWLVAAMLLLTLVSQFAISPRMHAIRPLPGQKRIAETEARHLEFDALHRASTATEAIIFLLGCTALGMRLPARRVKQQD